jgi:O-antigen/teichoic acid export membrane protein
MVLGHTLGYLVAAALQAAAALAMVAGLTRMLSDVEFGQYGLAAATLHLYQSVLFFWLRAGVSRFHASAEFHGQAASLRAAIRRCFLLTAGIGAAVGALAALALPISQGLRATIAATLVASVAQGAFTLVLELHRATLRAWRYALFQSLQAALGVGLSLGLVLTAGQVAGGQAAAIAMIGLAISFFLCAVVDVHGLRFWLDRARPLPGETRALMAYGLPLTLAMAFDAVLATGDRFVIAHFHGESAVGPYAAAVTLAHRSLLALCTVVGAASAPLAFAALADGGVEAARRRLADAGDLLLAIALPAAFGLAALAWPISAVMVAAPMRATVASLLPWIAAGALFHGLAVHYFGQAFLLARRPMALVWSLVPVVAVYAALNVVLVANYGAPGAAMALVASQALHVLAMALLGRRHFAMPLRWSTAAKAIAASAAMLALLHVLDLPGGPVWLAVQIALGAAVYGAAALALDIARCRARLAQLRARLA